MGVRRVRNNVIAHMNRSPEKRFFEDAAVTPNQIADLIDALCETLNDVARKFAEPTVISDGDRNERAVHCLLDTLRNVRWASHHDH